MPPLQNARRERFCQEYVRESNGTRSYKAAGYKSRTENSAAAGAVQVLRNIQVRERIVELQKKACDKVEADLAVDRVWVVKRLIEVVDRAMQAVPVRDRNGNPIGRYVFQGQVANRALELIGKSLGMFEAPDKSPCSATTVHFYLPSKGQELCSKPIQELPENRSASVSA